MTRRILCFGDSLTWGWVATPVGGPTTRYPFSERWTGAMAATLGRDHEILEEALKARTTSIDDPVYRRRGRDRFSAKNNFDLGNARADEVAEIFAPTV
jgi:lysophospholipase L1-like esterase